jgi:hypothetical protein
MDEFMRGFSGSTDVQVLLSIFPASLCPSSHGFCFLLGGEHLFSQRLLRYTFGKPTFREEVAVWKPKPN